MVAAVSGCTGYEAGCQCECGCERHRTSGRSLEIYCNDEGGFICHVVMLDTSWVFVACKSKGYMWYKKKFGKGKSERLHLQDCILAMTLLPPAVVMKNNQKFRVTVGV